MSVARDQEYMGFLRDVCACLVCCKLAVEGKPTEFGWAMRIIDPCHTVNNGHYALFLLWKENQ